MLKRYQIALLHIKRTKCIIKALSVLIKTMARYFNLVSISKVFFNDCKCSVLSVCEQQENMLWWQPTSTWRGKLVTLWSRHTYPASWQLSSPKCLSGSTENLSLPGLSLVSCFFFSFFTSKHLRLEPMVRSFQNCSWKVWKMIKWYIR